MILMQVCVWNFSNTPYSCIRALSEKDTYSCTSHMKLLSINVCYELMTIRQ